MKIIIPTCDKYRNIIEANKYTMDRYGGADLDVIVLGYKTPEFDMGSWDFFSLGEDTGPQNFTNDIWKFFKNFNDECFIYGNDDIVVVDSLDLDLLKEMEGMINKNSNVMKICATSAGKTYPNHTLFQDKGDFKYIAMAQNGEYRLALHMGIWRTSYFKKYFQLGISPWEWELRAIAKNDGAHLLGTVGRHFLDFGHIFRVGGRVPKNWYISEYTNKMLSQEDINFTWEVIKKCNK